MGLPGQLSVTFNTHEAYSVLLEKMDVVRGILHGFDYSGFEQNAVQLLPGAMNHILGAQGDSDKLDGKRRFFGCHGGYRQGVHPV